MQISSYERTIELLRHRQQRWRSTFMVFRRLDLYVISCLIASAFATEDAMSQCTTEKILLDSVFSMVEKRQTEQAFILFNSLDQSRVDPRGKLSICIEAYESGDTDLFKTVLLDLVVQHGFRNDSSTTGMLFADDITTGRHANWFGQLQDSCSMIFERTHIQRMVVITQQSAI